jgi:hypothetical protein
VSRYKRVDINPFHICKNWYRSVHIYQNVALQSEAIQCFMETVCKSLFSSLFLYKNRISVRVYKRGSEHMLVVLNKCLQIW